MAELIAAGGWKAERHPVTGDPTHPEALYTKAWVRQLIGSEKIVGTVVLDPDTGDRLGYLFFQPEAAAHAAGRLPNLQAGALVGRLLFGPAVYCVHGVDKVDW